MHRRATSPARLAAPLALLGLLATVAAPGARAFGLDFLRPLRLLEAVSTYFREHNAYPEKHVRETSASEVAAVGHFDFVVVGAGVGGAAVAARLSEENDWKVLLLEAGKDENVLTDVPVLSAVWQSTPFNWGYRTQPRPDACLSMNDHRCSWPRGKVIGGTSVINYMVHTRGHRLDYDAWAAAGNEGWSYDDVLPYFKRNERVLIEEYSHAADRGHDGPLNVERVPYSTPLSHAFVRAGRELGYPQVDYNAQGPTGFSLIQAAMRNGSRCSSNKAYLRPARDRHNLFITSKAQVTRVIIDPKTKHATGVEFVNGHTSWKVFATKEVILSAGVFNSPQLLMLSGVGPQDHLKELGIPLVQDLKVGYNLMEHYGFLGTTFTVNQSVSVRMDRILLNPTSIPEYVIHGTLKDEKCLLSGAADGGGRRGGGGLRAHPAPGRRHRRRAAERGAAVRGRDARLRRRHRRAPRPGPQAERLQRLLRPAHLPRRLHHLAAGDAAQEPRPRHAALARPLRRAAAAGQPLLGPARHGGADRGHQDGGARGADPGVRALRGASARACRAGVRGRGVRLGRVLGVRRAPPHRRAAPHVGHLQDGAALRPRRRRRPAAARARPRRAARGGRVRHARRAHGAHHRAHLHDRREGRRPHQEGVGTPLAAHHGSMGRGRKPIKERKE